MGTTLKPGRVVRIEIIVDAEDPSRDGDLNGCLLALGEALCDRGHSNMMRAELITPRPEEEREERKEEIAKNLN